MNKPDSNLGRTFPMRAESVNFTDGMIVTADDLSTAMAYPIALMQSVNRAVFGCGVVCGFELKPDPDLCGKTERCDPCDDYSELAYPSFTVQIGRGTAIDCAGLPVELCKPVSFDLGDKQCGCDAREGKVCIFIRRLSSPEAPRGDCCGSADERVQCSRLQDHVEIRAFPMGEEPENACMYPFDDPNGNANGCGDSEPQGSDTSGTYSEAHRGWRWPEHDETCKCLTTCSEFDCCGEGWILIGCLELCKGGILVDSFDNPYKNRKWIKTIECFCRRVEDKQETEGYAAREEEELNRGYKKLQNRDIDPAFEEKVLALFENEERAYTILASGACNWEQVKILLEKRQPQVQKAFNLKTADRIQDYKAMVDEQIKKERYG
ncbi:MAG: hypothetical protein LJE61_14170 [Thiocapsa sp.]|nr:hypothetical protein [Thiocapsa sp.]MCG6986334.1 hypothetical protein [Thiocapsa sp.]